MRDPLSLWVSKHIRFSEGSDPAFLQLFLASHSGITPCGPLLPGELNPLSGKPEFTKGRLCVCFSCALHLCSNSLPSATFPCLSLFWFGLMSALSLLLSPWGRIFFQSLSCERFSFRHQVHLISVIAVNVQREKIPNAGIYFTNYFLLNFRKMGGE